MSPNILRSVVKQVTLGERSVVSRRKFSRRPRRRNFSSSQEPEDSYFNLFGSSLSLGFAVVCGWESIQMLEYARTMQRSLDELAGKVSEWPLRDFMLDELRRTLSGE